MTHSRRILLTMTIGIFICILDTTVMSIALPAMQSGLHTDLAHLSWALNIYTILFACLTIPLGRIADIYGRERLYLVGLSLFFLGSIASGLAPTVGFLIAGRALQSVGAAIVFPASMTIGIQSTSLAGRTQDIALLGVTQGLAAAFGPTIGGVLTQYFGWRTIFLINLPLALATLGLCLHLLDWHHTGGQHETLDIPVALTSMLAFFSLSLLLIKGNDWGWTSWRIIGLMGTCGLALALFLLIESHVAQPMMPLALFEDQQFNGAAIVTVAAGIFFVALMVILPSFFTKIQGATELQAALMITPASLMLFICSPISGFLLSKIGPRAVIATGCLAILSGYITLSLSNPAVYWQVSIALMLSGAGYGVIIGPVTVLAAGDFSGKLLTASQSVIGVFRQIGTSLAVAIFVSALSANISTAKITVSHHAEQDVAALTIPAKAKRDTLKAVNHQLTTERVSAYQHSRNPAAHSRPLPSRSTTGTRAASTRTNQAPNSRPS
ncbi:MFS transporter [Levilactobacillus brevis]|uniref:MFS transporter n=1 Tax=Levilactobacillus brevis TaxID=1580 RepID=UPI002180C234